METKINEHIDNKTLAAFLDDALDVHEKKGVINHLRACDECRLKMAETSNFLQEMEKSDEERTSSHKGGPANNPWYKVLRYASLPAAAILVAILVLPYTTMETMQPTMDETEETTSIPKSVHTPAPAPVKRKQTINDQREKRRQEYIALKKEQSKQLAKTSRPPMFSAQETGNAADNEPFEMAQAPEAVYELDESEVAAAEPVFQQTLEELQLKLQTVYFPKDKITLSPQMKQVIIKNDDLIRYTDHTIVLEGNTDKSHPLEYSYALALRQAAAIREFMIQDGIDNERITIRSFGNENPLCVDLSSECQAKNRRVEFIIAEP